MESSRPVPTFAIGFLPGAAAGVIALPAPAPVVLAIILIAAAASVFAFSIFRPRAILIIVSGFICGLAVPAAHTGFYGGSHIRFHMDEIEGPVSVVGVITETPLSRALIYGETGNLDGGSDAKSRSFADQQGRGVIRIESVATPDGKVQALHGLARIKFYKIKSRIPVGTRIRVSGKLFKPFTKSVPGGFDYAGYLARQGIFASFVVSTRFEVEILGRTGFHPLADLRAALIDLTVSTFRPGASEPSGWDVADFLLAILLGERRLLTQERRELYVTSGTAHFLAISGLHLALFAGFLAIALRFIKRRPRVLIIAAAVTVYAAMAGFRPSVFRALVMILFYLGAILFRRQRRGIDALAAAAVLVLLVNPFDLVSAGFQLSFAGVLGIMLLCRPLEGLVTREEERLFVQLAEPEFRPRGVRLIWPFLRANLVVSLAAWLACGPLVAYCFHIVTPLAVIMSFVACLFIWIVIGGGFLALALVAVTGVGALARPIYWAVDSFHAIITIPEPLHAYRYIGDFSAWWLVAYYLLILAAAFRERLSLSLPFTVKRRWLAAAFALLAVAFFLTRLPDRRPEHFEFVMLDVGDRSCVVARTPEGGVMVYDVGATSGFNAGRSALAPYLWNKGVSSIDALIISHAQADHFGGVEYLLDKFKINGVYLNKYFCSSEKESVKRLVRRFAEIGIPVRIVGQGDEITAVPGLRMDVLAPTDAPLPKRKVENETSLVLRLERGNNRVLLTGDIEEYGYARLVESGADISADVVQVPHHGYGFENAADLAASSGASIFLISNYANRLSGMLTAPYRAVGTVYSTGDCGTITVVFQGGRTVVRPFRDTRRD